MWTKKRDDEMTTEDLRSELAASKARAGVFFFFNVVLTSILSYLAFVGTAPIEEATGAQLGRVLLGVAAATASMTIIEVVVVMWARWRAAKRAPEPEWVTHLPP